MMLTPPAGASGGKVVREFESLLRVRDADPVSGSTVLRFPVVREGWAEVLLALPLSLPLVCSLSGLKEITGRDEAAMNITRVNSKPMIWRKSGMARLTSITIVITTVVLADDVQTLSRIAGRS